MTDYTLTTLVDTAGVLLVRLTPPTGGEMQSTRIAFLPGGYIVIHGDLCPAENGLISVGGYGPEWFASKGRRLTPSYMAEKFRVPTVFIPEQAATYLREQAEGNDECKADFLRLADDAEDVYASDEVEVRRFLDDVEDTTGSPDYAESFYGHDPRIMDLLIQIQAAFARLWVPAPQST